MHVDAVREGSGLWFLTVEKPGAELPQTRHGFGGHSLCLEDWVPLPVR